MRIAVAVGPDQGDAAMTVLDALIQSLSRAGEYNRDDQVPPAVILWPDKE